MKTFRVVGTMVGSKYLGEIEAETAQEALDRAPEELDFWCALCHQCSDQCEDVEIDRYVAEEVDGEESAQVDGFWEGQYHKAQARVLELEQYMAKLVEERDEARELLEMMVRGYGRINNGTQELCLRFDRALGTVTHPDILAEHGPPPGKEPK